MQLDEEKLALYNTVKHFPKKDMTQANDIAKICSNLLDLPNSSVPVEIALNCQLETTI